MGLRLVYGRAGTGKSQFCYNEISEIIKNRPGKEKIYIITPEQFSFTAERKLLENIKGNSVIDAEVLTFNRMAYRVMNEVGGGNITHLSASGKIMLIQNILDEHKSELNFLGKNDKNIELISTAITEFKKHNISSEKLMNITDNLEDKYLKAKLKDLSILYSNFQSKIKGNYIDENDILTLLGEKLEYTDMFKNCIIYIDEFVGFTPQEYIIISNLLQKAKIVTITSCTDSIEYSDNPESDIFYTNKVTVNKLIDLANKQDIKIEDEIKLENNYRFKNDELKHLEKNIYATPYIEYNNNLENISLFLGSNQYSEIENVAKTIIKLVRDNGYRYKDISIITQNIDTYSSLVKAIFNKYNIPVFIDEKRELSQNILVKYILALLDVFSKNWTHDAVFNYIKTGFLDLDRDDYFLLENYCLKWGIQRSQWYKEDWNFGDDSNIDLVKLNDIRRKIVEPLIKLNKNLSKSKTIKGITKSLYEFLIINKIDKKIDNKVIELEKNGLLEIAKEYIASWNVLMEVFDELVLILGDEKITFDKYYDLLKIGLANSGLGKIPATADQVIVGDIDRSKTHTVKALFIIGLNDGSFPKVNTAEGFLDDSDREFLKEQGLELAKGTIERIYEDNYNIYKAFTTTEQKLYMTYASTNTDGSSLRGSILLLKLKKIFPKLIEKSDLINKDFNILTSNTTFDELLNNIRDYKDEKIINPKWFDIYEYYDNNEWKDKLQKAIEGLSYTNVPQKINQLSIQRLYGNILKTSISKLESYRSCPFSFYLKYGLKLQEKNTFEINVLNTGTFMHDVIDNFFKNIKINKLNINELSDEEIKENINIIVDEKLKLNKNYIFRSTEKFKMLTNRLKNVINNSMKYIVENIRAGEFKVVGNEIEFKEGANYPPITINLDNGKKVELVGKIDRVDIGDDGKEKYVRIIDSKSSVKTLNLNNVESGIQIQLLTYLDAITNMEKVEPAGVLYSSLIEPIIDAKKGMTEEDIAKAIRKEFRMKGLIIDDVKVIKMMDNNIEPNSSSEYIPVNLNKDSTISKNSSCVSKEEFNNLQIYIKQIIKEISNEILTGNIDIKPYYKLSDKTTPCTYCKYMSICQFDKECNKYNYIKKDKSDVVLKRIEEKVKKN